MGLLYPFPATAEETDFVDLAPGRIQLRTYGLPYLFWGYAVAALAVVFFLWLAVQDSLTKLHAMGDPIDQLLVRSLQTFLVLLPLTTLAFFFYEKRIERSGGQLKIQHRLFWLPLLTSTYELSAGDSLNVRHFMDAPNVARMKAGPEAVGFQNKGYFTLWATLANGTEVLLDRHSRKADLEGLKALLSLRL